MLCGGTLRVKIDDKMVSFSDSYIDEDDPEYDPNVSNYCSFWASGGNVSFDEDYMEDVTKGPWQPGWNEDDYPEEIKELLPQLLELFNENVPYGCCGGCV